MLVMRTRLIYVYCDIDYDIVWEALSSEISMIIPELEKLLAENHDNIRGST
ncbi:MAG: HepT-like ribonuclease domain-containing protein [Parachlamydiaceae bacterium]